MVRQIQDLEVQALREALDNRPENLTAEKQLEWARVQHEMVRAMITKKAPLAKVDEASRAALQVMSDETHELVAKALRQVQGREKVAEVAAEASQKPPVSKAEARHMKVVELQERMNRQSSYKALKPDEEIKDFLARIKAPLETLDLDHKIKWVQAQRKMILDLVERKNNPGRVLESDVLQLKWMVDENDAALKKLIEKKGEGELPHSPIKYTTDYLTYTKADYLDDEIDSVENHLFNIRSLLSDGDLSQADRMTLGRAHSQQQSRLAALQSELLHEGITHFVEMIRKGPPADLEDTAFKISWVKQHIGIAKEILSENSDIGFMDARRVNQAKNQLQGQLDVLLKLKIVSEIDKLERDCLAELTGNIETQFAKVEGFYRRGQALLQDSMLGSKERRRLDDIENRATKRFASLESEFKANLHRQIEDFAEAVQQGLSSDVTADEQIEWIKNKNTSAALLWQKALKPSEAYGIMLMGSQKQLMDQLSVLMQAKYGVAGPDRTADFVPPEQNIERHSPSTVVAPEVVDDEPEGKVAALQKELAKAAVAATLVSGKATRKPPPPPRKPAEPSGMVKRQETYDLHVLVQAFKTALNMSQAETAEDSKVEESLDLIRAGGDGEVTKEGIEQVRDFLSEKVDAELKTVEGSSNSRTENKTDIKVLSGLASDLKQIKFKLEMPGSVKLLERSGPAPSVE
ncbi:MAG: hypothetical protein K0U10_06775 [Gammaproteobacteria bacterium]|nr:hypothetical protein [Gammaproteobacteria bacterium]MCH9755947.1 hypothetical protein [Gammaproteobacteria bacterium]